MLLSPAWYDFSRRGFMLTRSFNRWNIGLGLLGFALGSVLWLGLRWGLERYTVPKSIPAYDPPVAYVASETLDDVVPDAGAAPQNAVDDAQVGPEAPKATQSAELHPVLGNTLNVLLLGLDKNPGVRNGGLTDTLIVAALDTERERLGLVSVPRDLFVSVENHGQTRVNAVYALARKDKIEPTAAF